MNMPAAEFIYLLFPLVFVSLAFFVADFREGLGFFSLASCPCCHLISPDWK